MPEKSLTLNEEEQDYLVHLLQETLKSTQIEEHRTRKLTYREHVVHQEDLIGSLLAKLGHPVE